MVRYNAQDEGGKPEYGSEEGECLRSGPLSAIIAAERYSVPIPDRSAIDVMEPVDENTEGGKPGKRKEEVGPVADHAGFSGNHPDEGKDDREGRDDLGVDCATERSDAVLIALVKEPCHDAEDNGAADELCEAQEQGDDA